MGTCDGSGSEWLQQPLVSVMEVEVVPGIKASGVTSQLRLWTPVVRHRGKYKGRLNINLIGQFRKLYIKLGIKTRIVFSRCL